MRSLSESQARARQLPIHTRLKVRAQRRKEEDETYMDELVGRLVVERRAQGDAADNTDLLGRMLTGVDKKTGEGLPDHNIRPGQATRAVHPTPRDHAAGRRVLPGG